MKIIKKVIIFSFLILATAPSYAVPISIVNDTGEELAVQEIVLCNVGSPNNRGPKGYGPFGNIQNNQEQIINFQYDPNTCETGMDDGAVIQFAFTLNKFSNWCKIPGSTLLSNPNLIIHVVKGTNNFPTCPGFEAY